MTQAVDVPQWQPTERDIADARVTDFARFVQRRTGTPMADYQSLWQWSVDDPAAFWGALWEYFELGDPPDRVLDNQEMPGARWFPGVRLNYVDQIVRNARTDRPAILHVSEDGQITELSWHELLGRTAAFAQTLQSRGGHRVPGDRQHRRHLERLRAGLFRQGGAGQARPARTGGTGHRRRLSVRR